MNDVWTFASNNVWLVSGIGAAVLLVLGLAVTGIHRGWFRRGPRRQLKNRLPQRLWRRGGPCNYMELFKQPDGGLLYHVHRAYEVKCPRCLEVNTSGWLWTIPHEEGTDPLPVIGSPRLTFSCSRCGDVHPFIPQIGPSEFPAEGTNSSETGTGSDK